MTDLARTLLAGMLTVSLGASLLILVLLLLHRPLARFRASTRRLLWLLVILRLAIPLTLPLSPIGLTLTLPAPIEQTPEITQPLSPETTRAPAALATPIPNRTPETAAAPETHPAVITPADTTPARDPVTPPVSTMPESLEIPEDVKIHAANPFDRLPVVEDIVTAPPETAPRTNPVPPPASAAPLSPTGEPPAEIPPAAPPAIDLLTFAALLWLGVAALLFTVRLLRGLALNRELARQGELLQDSAMRSLYAVLCAEAGLSAMPELRISAAIDSPLVYGFRRPTILLPEGISAPDAFSSVVLHELAHIRRHDVLLKPWVLLALSLHWWNPLAYLAVRRYEAECELTCDEAVLSDCDNDARRDYGLVLLDVLRRTSANQRGMTTHFRPDRRTVRARFEQILDSSPKRAGRGMIALLLVLCLSVGTLAACRLDLPVLDDTPIVDGSEPTTGEKPVNSGQSPTTTAPAQTTPPFTSLTAPLPVEDDRVFLPLTFTPVNLTPAKCTPICQSEGQRDFFDESTGEIRINAMNGTLVNTYSILEGWVTDLAIVADQHGHTALLHRTNGVTGFTAVDLPDDAQLLTMESTALPGDETLVNVAYMVGDNLGADGLIVRNGQVLRAYRAVYAIEIADLDGDRQSEIIFGRSYTDRLGLYMLKDGVLCAANPAAALQSYIPGSEVVRSHFDSSKNHFVITLDTVGGSEETIRASYYKGSLLIESHEALSAAPSMHGDLYLCGICSEDGSRDLILHATPDRVYYVYYYDGEVLMKETGLTSPYESGIYLWQTFGITVGMHYFSYGADNALSGYTWGNYRYGDRAVGITAEEYEAIAAEYEQRLVAQAEDKSIPGAVRLSTPLRTGDHEIDKLRVRVVNGSGWPISVGHSYVLERRDEDMSWYRVNENGTATFPGTRYTIPALSEAVIDLDLSVYTALLSDDGFYRVTMPVYTTGSSGTEYAYDLPCYFGGGGIGWHRSGDEYNWSHSLHGVTAPSPNLDAFTCDIRFTSSTLLLEQTHADIGNHPWQYLRLTSDSITIYYPRASFTSAYYLRDTPIDVTLDGEVIPVIGRETHTAEEVVAVTYTLGRKIAFKEGQVLSFTRRAVDCPHSEVHNYRNYWSVEVFDRHVERLICVDCGCIAPDAWSSGECSYRKMDGHCYQCDYPIYFDLPYVVENKCVK